METLTNQDLDANSSLVLLDNGVPYASVGAAELDKIAIIITRGRDGYL